MYHYVRRRTSRPFLPKLYLCAAFAYVRVHIVEHVRVYVVGGGGGGGGGGGPRARRPPPSPGSATAYMSV